METDTGGFEESIARHGERQNITELAAVVRETSADDLIRAIIKRLNTVEAISFWDYLLKGFDDTDESKQKRFLCVMAVLKQMNKQEMTYKHTEMIKRLCLDLPHFSNPHLSDLVEFCIDSMRIGDPKCTIWKDLLPEVVDALSNQDEVVLDGVRNSGENYRMNIVRRLTSMKWPMSVLTPIANMFQDMNTTSEEISTVLKKLCYSLQRLDPLEIPPLAFQTFTLCSSPNQVILPILSFGRYFYKHYYKKQFAPTEDSSDFDSIVDHSEHELREAEETVLLHLSYCTQTKISEQQIITVLRGLSASPDVILTPFVLSALLCMTKINRNPDAPLSGSVILPFLRNVVKNNEDEKEMQRISAWCRDTLQTKQIDLERIFTILIQQNKDGKDVVTPGLVNLAFVLLRTKNSPKMHSLAILFLQNFIKKRFAFGKGIVETVAEWMITCQDDIQYSDCLTALSLNDTYTVSECEKTIKFVLDFFMNIAAENAMRMLHFILPVAKMSPTIRDSLIAVLKKAMYSKKPDLCRLGIFGLCTLLKQLNNNNSQRSTSSVAGSFTQLSISGYGRTQATLSDRGNPQRHFNVLALEIIGLLQHCFMEKIEAKETLYETLIRSIELNPRLAPHIYKFVELNFTQCFTMNESSSEIHFSSMVVTTNSDQEIDVVDNLGRLTILLVCCMITCENNELSFDPTVVRKILDTAVVQIISKDLLLPEPNGPLDHKMNQLTIQSLNFLEASIYYQLWTSKSTNENVKNILELFKRHHSIREAAKNWLSTQSKKGPKKGKEGIDATRQTQNATINGAVVKKLVFKPENIWNLPTIERLLRLLHQDVVSFATSQSTSSLRSNRNLVRYVLEVACFRVEALRNEPIYKQVKHSKRIFKYLIDLTRVLYERCVKRLQDLWNKFDVSTAYLSAECLYQSLYTADAVYKRKFEEFIKQIDLPIGGVNHVTITKVLQKTIETAMTNSEELNGEGEGKKIPAILINCLYILYENIPTESELTDEGYNWTLKFCQDHELNSKDMGVIYKLLFSLRQKLKHGEFYDTIAMHLEDVYGKVDEQMESEPQFKLKSIAEATADCCMTELLAVTRTQIEHIEYFISKVNTLLFKMKVTVEEDHADCVSKMKAIERSICSQLIHITKTLIHITNTCTPLGPTTCAIARLITLFYVCMTNLTKHFISRNAAIPISLQMTKYDQVLKIAGKPLGTRVYNFIEYVETNTFENTKGRKVNDPQADKAKVLRETRSLPRLILRIETFNKFVMLLSKKTKLHLSHFLHIGTVRDFRIKLGVLKEAIEKAFSNSAEVEVDESMLEPESEQLSDDEAGSVETADELQPKPKKRRTLVERPGSSDGFSNRAEDDSTPQTTTTERGILEDESNNPTAHQVLQNFAKLNEKSKKRKKKDDSENQPQPQPTGLKKRGRGRQRL